jgi:HAD superfamily hydrolase (TIGR01484 family)
MVPTLSPLNSYKDAARLKVAFMDIDGTLTLNGQLPAESYQALWKLKEMGVAVVPVTGRPAGWCEMIARLWPADAVVGENGAFYFFFKNKILSRHFEVEESQRQKNQRRLETIRLEVQKQFPQSRVASDQFCRLSDLAIDFAEDVHPALSLETAVAIKKIFEKHGATAKVSSIHVNGWYGSYDKLSTCQKLGWDLFGIDLATHQDQILFVGDSPNDEPMFQFFKNSFAVANILDFKNQIQHAPQFVARAREAEGFIEIVNQISAQRPK